ASGCVKSNPPGLSAGSGSLPSAVKKGGCSIRQVSPPSRLRAKRNTDGLEESIACPPSLFLKYPMLNPTRISFPHDQIPLLAGQPPKRPDSLKTTTLFVLAERCGNADAPKTTHKQVSFLSFIVVQMLLALR